MVPATVSPRVEPVDRGVIGKNSVLQEHPRLDKLRWSNRLSLTSRILFVNIVPLALIGGGLIYLDSYRKQLLEERFKLALIEAQITAEALAGATNERQEALLIQIGKEQRLRLRLYNAEGELEADSFDLAPPSFTLAGEASRADRFALSLDRGFDRIVGAPELPNYVEPASRQADAWPELARAREENLTQIVLRDAPDGTHVITAAAPVGLDGETLLTTRNPIDITQSVRDARTTVAFVVLLALAASTFLSLFLARTIVQPLRELVRAALRVRQGRDRLVEVPRFADRNDEIGLLARTVSDMTAALRMRIDAVESFAADVAHEIKNPLASLRSALESLAKVDDPQLRGQLQEIAEHDVRRIDRLVSDISEASRIDAELSRATFEPVDLAELSRAIVEARESRGENEAIDLELKTQPGGSHVVMGVPARLERVIDNLLDNAISFAPQGSAVTLDLSEEEGRQVLRVCDRGPGIPPEAREKVFQRFHSLRPDEEDFGNHSGLGLAIGRTIAEAHEGTLTAHDRSDGLPGACLRLELPGRSTKTTA